MGKGLKAFCSVVHFFSCTVCSVVQLFRLFSLFSLFSCSFVQFVQFLSCAVVLLFSCSAVQLFSCSVVQLFSCSVVQLLSGSVVQLFSIPAYILGCYLPVRTQSLSLKEKKKFRMEDVLCRAITELGVILY